jgi:hypothetical protein
MTRSRVTPIHAGLKAMPAGGSTRASTIQPRRIRWAWRGRLALGYMGLWSGESSIGKGLLTCSIAADLTHGRLDGHLAGKPASVLIVACEDDRADVWRPRLEVAGADLDRVWFQDQGRDWNLRDDLELTARELERTGARFVLIDSVMDHLPDPKGGESIYQPTFVRRALGPFADLCRAKHIAGLISTHPPKAKGSTYADMVLASSAFVHMARVGLLFGWHPADLDLPDDERRRVLMRPPGGSNIGRNPGACEFKVAARALYIEGKPEEVPYSTPLQPSGVTFRDLTRIPRDDEPRRSKLAEAKALIDERLADGEWHPSMRDELMAVGFSKATTYRAAEHVQKQKEEAADGAWRWRAKEGGAVG